MSRLQQKEQNETIHVGWYGVCTNECVDFDLTQHKDIVLLAYRVNNDTMSYDSYDSRLPDAFNLFTKFACGNSYILVLKKGTNHIDIDNFVVATGGDQDNGRVVDQCAPSITPSATPSVTPSITPTVTPTPTPSPTKDLPPPSPSITPSVTPSPPGVCFGYQYTLPGGSPVAVGEARVQGVSTSATICHHGATGGAPSSTLLQADGQLVGVLVINGILTNSNILYNNQGVDYSGSVTPGATLTILTRV